MDKVTLVSNLFDLENMAESEVQLESRFYKIDVCC